MAKPTKRHNKILREIQRYSNDDVQRPKRKMRFVMLAFALGVIWGWTNSPEVSGLAWMAFLTVGIFMALDARYLLGRNPMDSIIRNMAKDLEKHSDY